MIDRHEATRLARASVPSEYVLLEEETLEESFGWVFFYQSPEFVRTGDFRDALVGNAPIVVLRNGDVHATGTAHPLEHYIERFRRASDAGELPGLGGESGPVKAPPTAE
jgi:hypothetical protein